MARCLIGCGSNLGRRREQLDRAVELLRFMPGVSVLAVSRYRETRPVGGPAGQPPFLNGACLIETGLPPHDVLGMLAAVENTLHRERTEHWAPRTLDLDLLLYDEVVLDTPHLTLPHPRMITRRFVLEPAAEIAADLLHPVAGCSVQALLDNLSRPHPLVAIVGAPGSGAPDVAAAVADAVMARAVHAPLPLPAIAPAGSAAWRDTLAAWEQTLDGLDWLDDPHGTIADFALDALRIAADELPAAEAAGFDAELDSALERTVPPQVAILLRADAARLGERALDHDRRTAAFLAGGSATTVATRAAGPLVDASPDAVVARLLAVQDRLARALHRPDLPRRPRAVMTIDATDLTRATAEATAAVEAML
ncbi:MAG: 2-amino-4-hydroxy-6-hydroxymethyldihydropteridine diphosphokinase [Planctomycetia bacterium]